MAVSVFPRNYPKRIMFALSAAACMAIVATGMPSPTWAQTAPEQEVDRTDTRRADLDAQITANNAAIQAMNDPTCPDVNYGDVLQDPDNVSLNVCYARTQISDGNLRGASATLERVLLNAPEALNVRLLYAIVLFRLDTIDEAEREFLTVASKEIPPDVRAEIDEFINQIERRRQSVKQSATIGFGMYFATNRNSAPDSEQQLAAGAFAPVALEQNRPNADHGFLNTFGYDFTFDPGWQDQHELFGGADIFIDTVAERSELDVHALNLDFGMRFRYPGITLTPRLFLSNMRLDWGKFYHSTGAEGRIDYKHKVHLTDWPLLDTHALFRVQDEDYRNTRNFGTLTLRSGKKYTFEMGAGMLIQPEHYLSLTMGSIFKSAFPDHDNNNGVRVFSYKEENIGLNHTWLLGDGHFLLSQLTMAWRKYQAADSLVVGATDLMRYENPNRVRMTYGLPLVDVLGDNWMPEDINTNNTIQELFNGTNLALSAEYLYQRSNITNFQYSSKRVQFLLTRKLDF